MSNSNSLIHWEHNLVNGFLEYNFVHMETLIDPHNGKITFFHDQIFLFWKSDKTASSRT